MRARREGSHRNFLKPYAMTRKDHEPAVRAAHIVDMRPTLWTSCGREPRKAPRRGCGWPAEERRPCEDGYTDEQHAHCGRRERWRNRGHIAQTRGRRRSGLTVRRPIEGSGSEGGCDRVPSGGVEDGRGLRSGALLRG